MRGRKIRVAVLSGGPSSEHEVSLKSGEQVFAALPRSRYRPSKITITKDGLWLRGKRPLTVFGGKRGARGSDLRKFDVVFVALHGKFGEDGRVQAILETIGVPYTGSGVLASALGMNKAKTNEIVRTAGLPIPKTLLLERSRVKGFGGVKKLARTIGYPCVVKPNASGSSVGTSIVREEKNLKQAVETAFEEDDEILIQKYVRGRELTCGVLGNSGRTRLVALPPVEIIPEGKFFDYRSKYLSKATKEICPAPVGKKTTWMLKEFSRRAHLALGCDGLTRSDFILAPSGNLYFLETNTIPGLTEASLCPKEARAAGMSFGEFLDKQVRLALAAKRRK